MINIEDIKSLCELHLRQLGGLKRLRITDFENFNGIEVAPGSDIYTISFRQWTGEYSDTGKSSRAGDYFTQVAQVYVPRHRFLAEKLVRELQDRKVVVYALDWNGDEHIMFGARFTSKFSTGAQLADSNGYEWRFECDSVKKEFLNAKIIGELSGDEGITPGGDYGGGSTPGPGTPAPDPGCCITIHTTPIAFVPTPTGNIAHRNKFIQSTVDGNKYVIDKNGASMSIGSTTRYEQFTGPVIGVSPSSISLAFPEKLIVIKNGVVLKHDPALSEVYAYKIQSGALIPFGGLEDGDYLQIYQI